MRIELKGEYSGGQAEMVLELHKAEHGAVEASVSLRLPGRCGFSFPCVLLGYDLSQFAAAIRRIHDQSSGCGTLLSSDENIRLDFTVEEPGRGVVSARGVLSNKAYYVPGKVLPDSAVDGGVEIRFGGFLFDQSWLPGVADSISGFLADEGVSTASPWGEG